MTKDSNNISNRQIASQVLDYWFAVEFLAQESYDVCTDEEKIKRNLIKFKKADVNAKKKYKQLLVFEDLNSNEDLYSIIKKQAQASRLPLWGNLTFYVGKVKRQECIEKLAKRLGVKLEQAEKSFDYIPVLSFQCDNKGGYIKHSLSLSTILWSLSQVAQIENNRVSEILSAAEYAQSVEALEEKLFASGSFDDFVISSELLDKIFGEIEKEYGIYLSEGSIEKKIGMKYQLFKDDEAKNKYDEDNYMGLSHDFFSGDLKLVKEAIDNSSYNFNSGMLLDLIKYICAPHDMFKPYHRYDFIKPEDEKAFFEELSEILNIANAPMGKWPSRYMPALMQQVAINFATSNDNSGIFEKNGSVFSVNGPPGTGKTTLLKEIVAGNIVEKARVLSQYEKPDDAFQCVKFKYGAYDGARSKFYPEWCKFKDDRIADYGMLVTSSNNAAVENITKELPMESGILDNLKPFTDGVNPDSEEMRKGIAEIRLLFSGEEAESEIYYTKYAKKFFGNADEDADAWGLVAAPLGKKSNIKKFYDDVLKPILWEKMSQEERTKAHNRYKKSRERFLAQLTKVQGIKETLKEYGEVTLNAHKTKLNYEKTRSENTDKIRKLRDDFESIKKQIEDKSEEVRCLKPNCKDISSVINTCKQRIDDLSNEELAFKQQALATENSVSIFTKWLRKSKYNSALELADSYRAKAEGCSKLAQAAKDELNHLNQLKDIQGSISALESEIDKQKRIAATAEAKRNEKLERFKSLPDTKTGKVLDEGFVEGVFSIDEDAATNAQVSNPWATEEYNREREKLFYCALQMTKEFLLSSKYCRRNLCILGQYWGLKSERGVDRIRFHKEDCEAMIGSLLQTLFLLTPVVSSTFASVGRLLKDIKTPGVIGTLVIDEAGQA